MSNAEDWNPDDYDPDVRARKDLEADEKWQVTSNQILQAWRAWPPALDRYAEQYEARTGRKMTAEHRAHVTQRFRERLREEHGTSEIDPRWEQLRNDRLRARGMIP